MAFSTQDSDEVLSEINVTPLVDVMLVLLVVFIVTAPLLTNSIPINLPKTESVAPPEQKDPGGEHRWRRQAVRQQGRDPAGAAGEQPGRGQGEGRRGPRAVAGRRRVNYGQVAKAMASIERAGITRLAVITAR